METQSFESHGSIHEKPIITIGNIISSVLQRIQHNKHVEKKRLIMTDTSFRRLFNGIDMKNDGNRLQSYIDKDWDKDVSMREMSSAGFCLTNKDDNVVCFSCKGVLSSWDFGNIPIARHIKAFPYCKFAKKVVKKSNNHSSTLAFDHATTRAVVDNDMELEDGIQSISFFNSEYNRLVSFAGCSINHPLKYPELAQAGFYYHSSDIAKCFACFVEIKEWKADEEPMVKHKQESPNCPFIKGLQTDNTNITNDELKQVEKLFQRFAGQSHSATPVQCTESLPHVETSGEHNENSQEVKETPRGDPMYSNAQYKEYFSEDRRMESFSNWPENHLPHPKELVKAGFFKSGNADQVTCFYCGLHLLDWEPGDDPLADHTREFPDCKWLEFERSKIHVQKIKEEQHNSDDSSVQKDGDNVPSTQQNNLPPEKVMDSLEEKIEKLEKRNSCKICLDEEVMIIFLPCKHLAVCETCAERVEACPICREYIDDKLQVFIP